MGRPGARVSGARVIEASFIIAFGALLGGFVSGLAGFGTGLVALGIFLHAVAPGPASSLVIICSVLAQSQTIPAIWHAIDLRRLWPMLLAGVLGVPFGTLLLGLIDPHLFRLGAGILLIVFSTVMLCIGTRPPMRWGGAAADAAIGFGGGVLGGLSGLSGPLPTMWAALRGWSKEHRRGVFQAYNLTILSVSLMVHAVEGLIGREVLFLMLAAFPGTVVGVWLGTHAYRRLSDQHFHQIVLIMLLFSGVTLVWPSLFHR